MTERAAVDTQARERAIAADSLTLLLVEDDMISRHMLLMRMKGMFKQIVVAEDGTEGFRLFCEHSPDIVLTDQMMPGLSGLELMRKIRDTGAKTPVVLMTSTIDNEILLEAINSGVERFLPKPFDFKQTLRTLTSIADEIIHVRLLEQHQQREMELLRYRDTYNSMQQESAMRKERHVVRHDLRSRVLDGAGNVRWGMHVAYSPRDIMCGDGYSIRNLRDGRQLVIVVDAMGSGMSASLTAMLATSFFNYQVDNAHLWSVFTPEIFLARFKEYLCSMLLEEEVLSCGLFLIDLNREKIEFALFGLPPLLVRKMDGSVRRICGENPPLGIYPAESRFAVLALAEIADLLIMTDGVSDAPLTQGGSYREVLERDFRAAPTVSALQRRFNARTVQGFADDLTLLHLHRLDFPSDWYWTGAPELSLAGLSRTIREFIDALSGTLNLDADERDELEVILTEALTNALEHGCMGIDQAEKTRLQLGGEYDSALENRSVLPGAGITLSATLWRGAETPLLLMEVKDNGSGLPDGVPGATVEKSAVNGRGLRLISRYSDSLFVGGPGGRLIILKTIEGGGAYAD